MNLLLTVFGFSLHGKHYMGDTPTRSGTYPYPAGLVLPSYSTSKTFFYPAALMALKQVFPEVSPDPFSATVGALVPNANAEEPWDAVTLEHLADMTTGHYRLDGYMRDEGASMNENNFFLEETHAEKIDHALNHWGYEDPPDNVWVYHTSDTYGSNWPPHVSHSLLANLNCAHACTCTHMFYSFIRMFVPQLLGAICRPTMAAPGLRQCHRFYTRIHGGHGWPPKHMPCPNQTHAHARACF